MDANFIGEVTDYLKCIVCHLVLKDPLLLVECGHRFCKRCYDQVRDHAVERNTPVLCPHDRKEVDAAQVVEDKGVTRAIFDLQVQCDLVNEGCFWTGELRNLQDHVDRRCNAVIMKRFMTEIETRLGRKDQEINELNLKFQENADKCEERDDKIKSLEAKSRESGCKIRELERQLLQKEVDLSLLKYNFSLMGNNYLTSEVPISSKQCSTQDPVATSASEHPVKTMLLPSAVEDMNMSEVPSNVEIPSVGELTQTNATENVEPGELKRQYQELKMQCQHKDVEIAMLKYQLAHSSCDDLGDGIVRGKKRKLDPAEQMHKSNGVIGEDAKNELSLCQNNLYGNKEVSSKATVLDHCPSECVHCERIDALEKSSQNLLCAVMNVDKSTPEEVIFTWEITPFSYYKRLGEDLCSPKFYTIQGYCCYMVYKFGEKREFIPIYIRVCKGIYNESPMKPHDIRAKFQCTDNTGNHRESCATLRNVLIPVCAEYRNGSGPSNFIRTDQVKNYLKNDVLTIKLSLS